MDPRGLLRRVTGRRRRRPRALCTIAIGPHLELLRISEPMFRAYAARHGYDLVVGRRSECPERPIPWSKVRMIRRLMRRYDLVVWLDVDATILDFTRDIAAELVGGADVYMVDHHYHDQEIPNTGILMVRSTPAADAFLQLVWDQTQFIDHPWWENAAILHLLGYSLMPTSPPGEPTPHRGLVHFIGTEWNSIDLDSSPHPVIRHYAGKSQEERLTGMRSDAEAVAAQISAAADAG